MLAIRIHHAGHLRAVLAAPLAATPRPAIISPVNAVALHGIGWWQSMLSLAMLSLARQSQDDDWMMILDCATSPGQAMSAIAAGIPAICVDLPPPLRDKISQMCDAAATRLLPCPTIIADLHRDAMPSVMSLAPTGQVRQNP